LSYTTPSDHLPATKTYRVDALSMSWCSILM
jgi:hypothetical protein